MPSEAMRAAMASAEVGDAWYGDDPTVNRLQDRAAELTGMEAALYVATGTMANQIGVRLHAGGQGHLVACETSAHVGTTEVMTSAVLAGIAYRTRARAPPRVHDRGARRAAARARRLLRRGGRRRARGGEHGRQLRRDHLAERGAPRGARRHVARGRAGPPRRRACLERGRGDRRGGHGLDGVGRHDDVLPQQRSRRADRLGALRPGRADPRSAEDLDPVRRRLASGGHHGRRRDRRAGDRAEVASSRTTSARGASQRRSPTSCPAASTSAGS